MKTRLSVAIVFALALVFVGAPKKAQARPVADDKLKFEIYEDKGGDTRWRLKSANGKILATSGQGYKAKGDCKKAVENIKANADGKLKFEIYEDTSKESRWRLKATNGQTVASSSEGYKKKADCEAAVAAIKKGAKDAEVEEAK